MIIFPAIDMHQGRCVRLLQGRPDTATVYSEDPIAMALEWEQLGAGWVHLVDLDGAMGEARNNRSLAKQIFKRLRIHVQFGGGVRCIETLVELMEAGASRVILGTAAIRNPGFLNQALESYREQLAIALDSRDGLIATRGWQDTEPLDALVFARRLASFGVRRIVFTDITRDGTLHGPNLAATRQMAEGTGLKVIASGGISSLDDVRQVKLLESVGVEGVIVGKALYEKKFTLNQALNCS